MTTQLRTPCMGYSRMTTQNSRDRMMIIASSSAKIKWREPKIKFDLKIEIPEIIGRIIAPLCMNGNILITVSISFCKKYIFVTEYDLKTNSKKNTYQIKFKNEMSSSLNYIFYFENNDNTFKLIPTTFDNDEKMYIYYKDKNNYIEQKLKAPARLKVYNGKLIFYNKKKWLFWADEDGHFNRSAFNSKALCFDYFPTNSNGKCESLNGLEPNYNITTISLFGGNKLLIINPDLPESITYIMSNSSKATMKPLNTQNKKIQDRFRQCVRYKAFPGKLDHVFVIMDEKKGCKTRTTVLCLDVLQLKWIEGKGNFPPNLNGIFLNETMNIFASNYDEVCYCTGNWRKNKFINGDKAKKKSITYHILEINVWKTLPDSHKQKVKQMREYLSFGFIKRLEMKNKLDIPIALKCLCNKFTQ